MALLHVSRWGKIYTYHDLHQLFIFIYNLVAIQTKGHVIASGARIKYLARYFSSENADFRIPDAMANILAEY